MDEQPKAKVVFGGLACGEGDPLCQLEGSNVQQMQDPKNQRNRLPHLLWQLQN